MERERQIRVQRGQTCPLCRTALLDEAGWVDCTGCGAVYHAACAGELAGGRCATPGCARPRVLVDTIPSAAPPVDRPGDVKAVHFPDAPSPPGGAVRPRGLPAPIAYLLAVITALLALAIGLLTALWIGGDLGLGLAAVTVIVVLLGAQDLLLLFQRGRRRR